MKAFYALFFKDQARIAVIFSRFPAAENNNLNPFTLNPPVTTKD